MSASDKSDKLTLKDLLEVKDDDVTKQNEREALD